MSTSSKNSQPNVMDIAIIGGGVSGAYTAYRLLKTAPNESSVLSRLLKGKEQLDVRLFERTPSIGGRLWSYHFPDIPNQVAELGGHAFYEVQQNVYGLCTKELGLEIIPAPSYFDSHIQYLRRHHFNSDQYVPEDRPPNYYPDVIPYFLKDTEKWQFPSTLVQNALEESVPGTKALTQEILTAIEANDWTTALKGINALTACLREAKIGDQPIYECGFWNHLANKLSIEAYEMASKFIAPASPNRNLNLYDGFVLYWVMFVLSFTKQAHFVRLRQGYQTLPEEMIKRFVESGGTRLLRQELYSLQTECHNCEQLIALTVGTPGTSERQVFYARYVVLAMPQRALQRLDQDSFIFQNAQFVADINTIMGVPSSKLYLTYDKPWWKSIPYGPSKILDNKITAGNSITDLPLQTCYYFTGEKDGKSLLMATANENPVTEFWSGYLPGSCFTPVDWPLCAPTQMVTEAQRQLKEMHDYDIPEPLEAIYRNWTQEPYGGGWHLWKPHLRSWEVIPRIRQPVPESHVFLCGEAYSAQQGWVEGAINNAEVMLETHFGLPRPDWVNGDYDFGP